MSDTRSKSCNVCGKTKPYSDFYPKKRGKAYATSAGISSACTVCIKKRTAEYRLRNPEKTRSAWRESKYRTSYGINLEDYNRLFAQQGGKCAICGLHQSQLSRALACDHNHETGSVRALTCANCNIALGMVKESIETLRSMIRYVETYRKSPVTTGDNSSTGGSEISGSESSALPALNWVN